MDSIEKEQLLNALNSERDDVVAVLAANAFFIRGSEINQKAINEFQEYADCQIFISPTKNHGMTIAYISYKGNKFYFG